MNIFHRFSQIQNWVTSDLPDSLSEKDKIRVVAINSFGVVIVLVCIVYAAIFNKLEENLLFWVSLGISAVCSIPIILNWLRKYYAARIVYVFQSPIFVLFFCILLGDNLGVQYFFILLFSFPFIYLKPKEIKYTSLFFFYNISCIIIYEFFPNPFGLVSSAIDPEIFLPLKITIISLLLFFTAIIFLVFQRIMMKEEENLRKIRYDIEKASQVKQEFLATMSHELRTPLNAVITISNILEENPDHKDKYAFIRLLKQSSNNLLSIINDILDFSKLEANKMKVETQTLDLRKAVRDIADTYKSISDEKGLKMHLDIDNDLAKFYKVDDVKLSQILGNLISNGIKFTDHGEITIRVKKDKSEGVFDHIYFEVSDTGQGISKTDLENIFESFTQIKSVLTRNTGGTGLGLAIVKRLLKIQNSDIVVESAPGIGSKFYFKLKLKVAGKLSSKKSKEFGSIMNKRLLLVEDNAVNAMVAVKLLENWGLIIELAENGKIAVDKCANDKYDFILMDLHMPIMDGFKASQTLREQANPNQFTPIYALTADVMGEGNTEFHKYFDGFLTKPIQKEKLQGVLVNKLTKSSRAQILDED